MTKIISRILIVFLLIKNLKAMLYNKKGFPGIFEDFINEIDTVKVNNNIYTINMRSLNFVIFILFREFYRPKDSSINCSKFHVKIAENLLHHLYAYLHI